MKAIIFAAGLGSRLGPETKNLPKALVAIQRVTLLELAITRLRRAGFNEVILNIHHFGEEIRQYLLDHSNFGIRIEFSDESEDLLETGGGLMKASWFFDDGKPFIAYNVDILTDLDLGSAYRYHLESRALVTLACKSRKTRRYFLADESGFLCGWQNLDTGEMVEVRKPNGKIRSLGYSGIAVIQPALFEMVTEEGAFSLTPLFLRLAGDHMIRIYQHDPDFWMDIGKPVELEQARSIFKKRNILSL